MQTRVRLGYGARPYLLELGAGAQIVEPPVPPSSVDLAAALEAALDRPVASPRLEALARPGGRALILVSDATRADPRRALLTAVRRRLGGAMKVAVGVATGTHGPARLEALDLPGDVEVINHDGFRAADLVELGRTRRGTPLRVHRALCEVDLVVATGVLRPHYFAGWGAGAKAIFPGLGENEAVRVNHRLKGEPGARAGVVDGNPCRDDLEEVLDHLDCPAFLLNVVIDPAGGCQGAVAGDVRLAFRAGAERADPLFRARAPRSRCVVVSDEPPVTASLYQASKLVAAAAEVVADAGTIVVAADCAEGTGPLATVNEKIFALGIEPRLPPGCRVVLVSDLPPDQVASTYCDHAESVEAAIAAAGAAPLIIPRAGHILLEPA